MKKIIYLIFCLLFFVGCHSKLAKEEVMMDARSSQKIDESWLVKSAETDELVALLFYSEDQTNHKFSIYVNDGKNDYHFVSGGSAFEIENQVRRFTFDGKSYQVFISMNQAKITKYKIDNLCNAQETSVNKLEPFVVVLPLDSGDVSFYDQDGNKINVVSEG